MARRSDHTRDEIQHMAIQAAIAILNREGANGLSTRKVARQIGYTVGTLYLVFKNLDELILHVNAATLDDLYAQLRLELENSTEARQQLLAMARAYLRFAQQYYARWSLLFTHSLPEEEALPDWFRDKVNSVFALVAAPLQHLQSSLDAPASQQATYVLWSGVHGVCELGLNNKLGLNGEIAAEDLVEAVVKNFLKGFMQGWE